ncbi:YDR338C [Saccharomyces arboricola H-6]|uniref:YDR338C n=1 Tax=Saccharomyces arboricola (strain H-6 / AS 2.3317 / CBS 10644) TaxID=1160507 RepID=J8Q3X5_SACAR|nr:YDR338C [Saccharomyces arboricola H-6]
MAGILSKTLSEVHPSLRTNGMGIGNTHRRISLGFLAPNKNNPLVRKFRARTRNTDQRSFRSLTDDFGSNVHEPNPYLGSIEEEPDLYYHDEEDGELSRTISLPSRVSETPELSPQDVDWILHEHERRYSSVYNSDNEEASQSNTPDRTEERFRRELEYEEFMERLQAQKQKLIDSTAMEATHRRRPSFVSVTSRGSVPTIYQEINENNPEALAELAHSNVTFKSEAKVLASYSFPLIFTFLLEQIFPMVCSLTVGHLGKNELAAVSLASMTSNITLAIFEGIATSLDTLCPQAYGSGKFYSVGIHLQRCIAFSLVIYIPFAFMWWYSEPILSYIIPEKELISLTSKFLRVLILGAPAYIFFENLKRFLQAQGIFDAGIYVLTICAPLNVFVSYTLVWNKYIGVGFIGAAIAVVLNFWLMFFLLLLYAIHIEGRRCWGGFSKKALTHWNDLGHLAFSGIIMLEAEELSYELLTLFSAYYGVSYLAAQSAVSTMAALLYMVPFAIGISTSTRIANFIGAKRTDFAHISSQVGLSFSFIAGLVNCCTLVFGRNTIANVYSKDPEVIKLIAQVLPLVGIIQNFDSLNAVAGSCLRGQGMQSLGGIVNLLAYYLFGIPLALILSWFFDMKLYGLWIGIGSAMLLIGLVEAYYVLYPDWDKIMTYAEILKETEDDEVDSEDCSTDSDDPDENTALLRA